MRKALHLLGILDDVDIDWMAINGKLRSCRAGEVLIREKQPIDSLFILLDGQLIVSVGGVDGKRIATLLPGEIVGEMSFVDSRPPSASVVATKDSEVLGLSRALLSTKLATDPAFAMRFYHSVATFLADRLYVTVGRFGYGSARQDVDVDELPASTLDEVDLATVRFDKLLRQLRGGEKARGASM
jgi:CRP/FNR family transcriptional regulator, cyclic AMP receptor protein